MSNRTIGQNVTEITFSSYVSHFGYGSQGLVMCLGNGLLLLTIFCEESLRKRKEMLVIVGLVAADLTYGLGALLLALYRIVILLIGAQFQAATAWQCVKLPPLFLTHIGAQLNALMSFVVSIDRYIAVVHPIYFRNLGTDFSKRVLLGVSLYGLLSLALMLTSTYFSPSNSNMKQTVMCYGSVFPDWYALYQFTFILIVGFLAISLYIGAFVKYILAKKKTNPTSIWSDNNALVQRRLTVTFGLITLSTAIFFMGPYSIFAVAAWMRVPAPQPTLLGTISRFSTIINILIFAVKQKDVGEAMKKMFKLK